MAETLAELYWSAHIDANDVESVLAPAREGHPSSTASGILRDHVVWVLDFDCCKHIPMDEAGVEQAVKAFYNNDPFFPRPDREDVKDQALWHSFKGRFLEASSKIVGPDAPHAHLPALWIDLVEKWGLV